MRPVAALSPFRSRRRLLILIVTGAVLVLPAWLGLKIVKTKHSSLWVTTYFREWLGGRYAANDESQHFVFLMCDHWEPGGGPRGQERANFWLSNFRKVASRHKDSLGRHFQYTWFYPIDNFDPVVIDSVAATAKLGFGEIEVHWHHGHPDGATFERDLAASLPGFTRVGALIDHPEATPRFSFIHGNWALDNSGAPRLCGVDEEIRILQEHGCYADFTFPALGTSAQPRMFNRIFYATDTPEPKSYDLTAKPAKVGDRGEGLMMVPGPLGFDFRDPRIFIEYGCLDDAQGSGLTGRFFKPNSASEYFRPHRVDLWNRIGVGVEGRPEWVFVKIHAHGIPHRELFFAGEMDAMLSAVEEYCRDSGLTLHYVTAREAYNIARAAEAGLSGNPASYYDFEIPAPMTRMQVTNP